MVSTADPTVASSQTSPEVDEVSLEQEPKVGIGPLEDRSAEIEVEGTSPPVPSAPPTPLAPPTPPAPPIADVRVQQEWDTLRQERARLAQQEAVAREKDDWATLQTAQSQLARELEEQEGLTPERAAVMAQRQLGAIWQAYQVQRQAQANVSASQAKMLVAEYIGRQYSLPVSALLQYNSPEAMQAAAQQLTEQGKTEARVAALERENAALKKAAVPSGQVWETGRAGARRQGGREALRDRYINGESLTPQEKASLFPDR